MVSPSTGIHWMRSIPVLPRLLSTSTFQPFATAPASSTRGDAVSRTIAPVNFAGLASEKLKELVGISLSGSSSRSKPTGARSEEHTSELQSRFDLVCRLLLEKKKKNKEREKNK